jgi:4-hydroxybenzoate polyprenyltransferase
MRVYLREMFPVPIRLSMAVLLYAGFARMLARLHGWDGAPAFADLMLGSWSAFATMLVLRLMDELKDRDVDRSLFASRPLPSGRVLESDIRLSLGLASALFLAAHLGRGPGFWTAVAVLGYAGLMFRWFFVPTLMRPRLLLTLVTHNPVVVVLLLHLAVLAGGARGNRPGDLDLAAVLPLIVIYWAPVFAWEIARKVRAPEEEDAYVTYSRLLGRISAVSLVSAAQTTALVAAWILARRHALHPAWIACITLGWLIAQAAHARFLVRPDAGSSRLRPFAELFLVSVLLAALAA